MIFKISKIFSSYKLMSYLSSESTAILIRMMIAIKFYKNELCVRARAKLSNLLLAVLFSASY